MKRTHYVLAGIALLAMLSIGLTGCPDEPAAKGSGAVLTSITVSGNSPDRIKTAITKAQWDAAGEDLFDYSGDTYVGFIEFSSNAALANAPINTTASAGAKLTFGASGDNDDKPGSFSANKSITLEDGGFLYVRVASEDGKNVNYYRFQAVSPSRNADLQRIEIGSIGIPVGRSFSTEDSFGAPQEYGILAIGRAEQSGTVLGTPSSTNSTVAYAKVDGSTLPATAPAFTNTTGTGFNFSHGDILLVKVTAPAENYRIYYFKIEVGTNAVLASLTIAGIRAELGSPEETTAVTQRGTILIGLKVTEPVIIAATPEDEYAKIKLAIMPDVDSVPTALDWKTPAQMPSYLVEDSTYLWVHVESDNSQKNLYYKIQINLLQEIAINIGSPEIRDGYIDPIWDDVPTTLPITKVFKETSESNPNWYLTQDTFATAKLLFDGYGVYAYVRVEDPSINIPKDVTGSFHTHDSFELFINEKGFDASGNPSPTGDISETAYGAVASQYRVGAAGQRSGHPSAAISALNDLNRTSSWKSTIPGEENVYYIIMQAPWRHLQFSDLQNGLRFGVELQVNACRDGTRDGVIVWNNVAHTNYQNLTDYGVGVLDYAGQTLKPVAAPPSITKHPSSDYYPADATAITLEVAAVSTDTGTITYQWYRTTSLTAEGTAINGATNATFNAASIANAKGDYFFYVNVINTVGTGTDSNSRVAKSNVAKVSIFEGELTERLLLENGAFAAFKFTIPAGKTWNDYEGVAWEVMLPASTLTRSSSRLRLYGNFPESAFGLSGSERRANMGTYQNNMLQHNQEDKPWADLIKDEDGVAVSTPVVDTWYFVNINFASKTGAHATAGDNWPTATATGPFFFTLGFSHYGGSAYVDQIVKNVRLVGKTGTDDVISYGSGFAEPTFIAWGAGSIREIIDLDADTTCKCDTNCAGNHPAHTGICGCPSKPASVETGKETATWTITYPETVARNVLSIQNKNGSWPLTSMGNTGFMYQFPSGFADFDFFTVETEVLAKTGTGVVAEVMFKHFGADTGYTGTGAAEVYPNLGVSTAPTTVAALTNVSIARSGAGGTQRGISLFYNQYAEGRPDSFTVRISKITFTKGTRRTVTIDPNGGYAASNPTIKIVTGATLAENFILGRLPTTMTHSESLKFEGWKVNGTGEILNNAAASAVAISADTTFVAQWGDPPEPSADIEFITSATPGFAGGNVTVGADDGPALGTNESPGTVLQVPIPAGTVISNFTRVVLDLDTYVDGTLVQVPASQWSNNIGMLISDGTTWNWNNGNNAAAGGSLVWTLISEVLSKDFTSGNGYIRVQAFNKTDSGINKVVIRSIKLVALVFEEIVVSTHPDFSNGAIVKDNGATAFGAYSDIVAIPIPATIDMTKFNTLSFDIDAYTADGTLVSNTSQYNNDLTFDLFNTATGGTMLFNGGNNAGAGGAYIWILPDNVKTADFTSGGRVVIKGKNGTNQITKIEIRSIRFIQ